MWRDAETEVRRLDVQVLTDSELNLLKHDDARAVFDMWTALRGPRPAPFRAELDAAKIGRHAPFLAIFEMVGPSNFRIRIAGDRLNRWFGLELRGMSALTLTGAEGRTHLQALLNRVTGEPAAAAAAGLAHARDAEPAPFEAVMLPMRSDFGPVDRVLWGMWLTGDRVPAGPVRLEFEQLAAGPLAPPEPSPALAEAPAPSPADDAPAFRTVEGDGAPARPVTRGHLRLVKTDTPQRRK